MNTIDIHAHAFPDALAERAVPALEKEGNVKAFLDGKVSALLRSMDAAEVAVSVICSIATRPEQFGAILKWSGQIASARLVPFPSVHPADPQAVERVRQIAAAGFKGIKMHPYYQDYLLDEERLFPLYEEVQRRGLLLLVHTGFDIAFPRDRRGDPARIAAVTRRFPDLKFISTHMGAWDDWDEVERHVLGRPILMETSYSLAGLGPERMTRMLQRHPRECLLFGTDSPWGGQAESIRELRALDLGPELERALFHENARRLLGLADQTRASR